MDTEQVSRETSHHKVEWIAKQGSTSTTMWDVQMPLKVEALSLTKNILLIGGHPRVL